MAHGRCMSSLAVFECLIHVSSNDMNKLCAHQVAFSCQSLNLPTPLLPKGSKTVHQQNGWRIRIWYRLWHSCEVVGQETLQISNLPVNRNMPRHFKLT